MAQNSEINLAPIWADATPLSDYLNRKISISIYGSDQDSTKETSPTSSALHALAAALQAMGNVPTRFEASKKKISNDLIAGRISAIGRKANSHRLMALEPPHWIGSIVDWSGNSMTRGRVTYVDIRIVDPESTRDTQSESKTEYQGTSDVVQAAIAGYATEDPDLSEKPEVRYRAYREFIRDQGYDPHKDRGFSPKTFQAYEAKFRKENKGQ